MDSNDLTRSNTRTDQEKSKPPLTPTEKGTPEGHSTRPPLRSLIRSITDYLIAQWFIFGLGLAIGLAAAFPKVGMANGSIRAEYTVEYGCIALIFLITGLSISTDALIRQAKNWRLHTMTQVISFLLFSAIIYGIVACIRASGTSRIDAIVEAGLILLGVLPTTVASNIAMTRNAGGSVEAATIEVCIGNTVGTFITPLLLKMYLQPKYGWDFIQPKAESGNGLTAIYSHMGKQLGATLFAPLVVGQIVQNLFKAQTKKWREILRLNYVGQVLLLLVIWSTFCDKFASGAFEAITHESVILICFLGVGMYGFVCAVCIFLARLPFLGDQRKGEARWKNWLRRWRFGKEETTAMCFCAAAKGLVLGAPLISILYGGYDEETKAIMSTPIALYQGTQVCLAQLSVMTFKRWLAIPDKHSTSSDEKISEDIPRTADISEKVENRSQPDTLV
ncbi:hypothetical protein FRC02_003534 [Tulasnella sp. 418]|nr:hypothetical protein FRC02_003534 [Tulasnella sp. 418]